MQREKQNSPDPAGHSLGEIFGLLVLPENDARLDAKNGAAGALKQGFEVSAVFAIVNWDELLPERAHGNLLSDAFDDYGLLGVVRADDAARVRSNVPGFASARAGTEPESILPPNAPHNHEMRAAIRSGCGNPIIVRIFETLERPTPRLETGGGIRSRLQCVWPMRTAGFGFGHGTFPEQRGYGEIVASQGY